MKGKRCGAVPLPALASAAVLALESVSRLQPVAPLPRYFVFQHYRGSYLITK